MTDDDLMLTRPDPEFGSGVIGVCDVCGQRQAVIVLRKERFKLCVLDFLNKSWIGSSSSPGAPLPPYRSERIWYETPLTPDGTAPAIVLSPTKVVRHPIVLITPDIFGLTTALLDGAIRFARQGFEVLLPDILKTAGFGPREHLALRGGLARRKSVPLENPRVGRILDLYGDALRHLRTRDMVDPEKSAFFGASYGASLAIGLATREQKLTALALAYPRPVEPPAIARLITAPTLLARGGRDPVAQRAEEQLRAAMPGGAAVLDTVYFAAARHNFLARDLRAYDIAIAEEAWKRILGFVHGRLMPPPPRPPPPPTTTTAPPLAPVVAAPAPAKPAPPVASRPAPAGSAGA
jgi:dienelactone hydrolase